MMIYVVISHCPDHHVTYKMLGNDLTSLHIPSLHPLCHLSYVLAASPPSYIPSHPISTSPVTSRNSSFWQWSTRGFTPPWVCACISAQMNPSINNSLCCKQHIVLYLCKSRKQVPLAASKVPLITHPATRQAGPVMGLYVCNSKPQCLAVYEHCPSSIDHASGSHCLMPQHQTVIWSPWKKREGTEGKKGTPITGKCD